MNDLMVENEEDEWFDCKHYESIDICMSVQVVLLLDCSLLCSRCAVAGLLLLWLVVAQLTGGLGSSRLNRLLRSA